MARARVTVYDDRSFVLEIRTPPTAFLLRQAAGVERGSASPRRAEAGAITREQLREIARVKLPDLNARDLEAAASMVAGTARSMGIAVRDGRA